MSNRIIKDSITTSETLALLSGDEERHFFRLITKADDYGRFDARPHVIRAGLYAAMLDQVPTNESERRTLSLAAAGLISLYDVDGRRYGLIITWEKHQRVRAKVSKFPPPPSLDAIGGHLLSDDSTRQHAPRPATSGALILNPESRIQNPLPPGVPLSQGDSTHANEETNDSEAKPKPKPPDGNPQSKSQPKRAGTTARAAAPSLTTEQESKLVAKWSPVLPEVGERINLALSHVAARKYGDTYRYVDNWLRNDASKIPAAALSPNGHDPPHIGAWRPWPARNNDVSEAEKESKRQQEVFERDEQRAWSDELERRYAEQRAEGARIAAARERPGAVASQPPGPA